jgi:hypothetical protein
MNAFQFLRAFETLTPEKLEELAVQSVVKNEEQVISDSIVANADGFTFSGSRIDNNPPFTDWEETGEFHRNLKFRDKSDIEFYSTGKGAESIFAVFDENETIAPSAAILDASTISVIKNDFINNIKAEIK